MIHGGVSGQASRRAAVMMAGERGGRQTAVGVHHVSMNRRRTAVVQHARIRGCTAHRARGAVMVAGESGVRGIVTAETGVPR